MKPTRQTTIAALAALLLAAPAVAQKPLASTISIDGINYYRDGGTTSVYLTGADGATLIVGIGMGPIVGGRQQPGRVFVGAEHDSQPGSRRLDLHGPEEERYLRLVWRAIEDNLSGEEIDRLLAARRRAIVLDGQPAQIWHLVRAFHGRLASFE